MSISRYEMQEHYNFYVGNCAENEIPLDYEEWHREYAEEIGSIFGGGQSNA